MGAANKPVKLLDPHEEVMCELSGHGSVTIKTDNGRRYSLEWT